MHLVKLSLLLILISCSKDQVNIFELEYQPKYSSNFRITKSKESFFLETKINDSLWQQQKLPKEIKNLTLLSSTFTHFVDTLIGLSNLVAMDFPKYSNHSIIKNRVSDGSIISVNSLESLDIEKLVESKTDWVAAYLFSPNDSLNLKRLSLFNIQHTTFQPYKEAHPLGRLEWLVAFGYCFNKSKLAKSIFQHIDSLYVLQTKRVPNNVPSPSVLLGAPYRGTWWMSGGNSLTVQFLKDAKANYLWKENKQTLSFPVSLEEVLTRGKSADYWINTSPFFSYNDIAEKESRLEVLKVFKTRSIYHHSKGKTRFGDDFFEYGAFRPDLILRDLINIFYFPHTADKKFRWYSPLPEK